MKILPLLCHRQNKGGKTLFCFQGWKGLHKGLVKMCYSEMPPGFFPCQRSSTLVSSKLWSMVPRVF